MGLPVLRERESALGVALWLGLRAVWTWAEARPETRVRMKQEPGPESLGRTAAGCSEAPELAAALQQLVELTANPEVITEESLGQTCRRVSEWALSRWHDEIAVHFAEAAARADAGNPVQANYAGMICRRVGAGDRAAVWYERAFRLAIRNRTPGEAIRAQLGYGAIMKDMGRSASARTWFRRAAKRALRTGRRREAAEAFHDLFGIAAESGKLREAGRYALRASQLYPLYHPRFAYLSHDFAFLLIQQQQYALAHPLLDAFVRVVPPRDLLPGLGTLAWAAAGRGLAQRFDAAMQRALRLTKIDDEAASATYRHLAEGARLQGRWSEAEQLVTRAWEAARARKDAADEQAAEALSADVAKRMPIAPHRRAASAGQMALVRQFAIRLRRWKGPRAQTETSNEAGGQQVIFDRRLA